MTMNTMTLTMVLMLCATARADWWLFTRDPQPVSGVTVVDVRQPLARNDDLRAYVGRGLALPGVFPALVHDSGFQCPTAEIDDRDALLGQWMAQQDGTARIGAVLLRGSTNGLELSGARLVVDEADVEMDDHDRGVILRDDAGNRWLLVASQEGQPVLVQISASPEVDIKVRRQRIADARATKAKELDAIKAQLAAAEAEIAASKAKIAKAEADIDSIKKEQKPK
jgi:hypothetical protein